MKQHNVNIGTRPGRAPFYRTLHARALSLFARLVRFINPEEIILSGAPLPCLTGFRGVPILCRRQKKTESKFKENREERRLELSLSFATQVVGAFDAY